MSTDVPAVVCYRNNTRPSRFRSLIPRRRGRAEGGLIASAAVVLMLALTSLAAPSAHADSAVLDAAATAASSIDTGAITSQLGDMVTLTEDNINAFLEDFQAEIQLLIDGGGIVCDALC